MFQYFLNNEFCFPNQWGFKPGDSCINQLIAITHKIHKGIHDGLEVRRLFLDISKAVGKVWHRRLIYELQLYGSFGKLLKLPKGFLVNRKRRVDLDG